MRRRSKVDVNQQEIVKALRRVGASVDYLHTLGKGVPDLLVGFRAKNYLMEIKDGMKSESRRKLTDDEQAWHLTWAGQIAIVYSVEDALRIIGIKI